MMRAVAKVGLGVVFADGANIMKETRRGKPICKGLLEGGEVGRRQGAGGEDSFVCLCSGWN